MMFNCDIPSNTLVIIGERKRVRERELKIDRERYINIEKERDS